MKTKPKNGSTPTQDRPAPSRIFYIQAPPYTEFSAGVRCLFLLCHHLNRLGYEAHMITEGDGPGDLAAPTITADGVESNRLNGRDDIVIYPEIVAGNPIGGNNVVRYLLNKPGFFTTVGMEGYGPDDFFIHFSDDFRPQGLASIELTLQLVDREVFRERPSSQKRRGFVLYSNRQNIQLDSLPDWVKPYEVVSMENPRSPVELAELYSRSEALVLWERTGAIAEAIQCGCPVIIADGSTFRHDMRSWYWKGHYGNGIAVGWDRDEFLTAQSTVRRARAAYDDGFKGLDDRLHEFVLIANKYFDKEAHIRELEKNTRTLERVKRELSAVYSSTSWRATVPLRFIKELYKGTE